LRASQSASTSPAVNKRDKHRWELDPASSEDDDDR
jgi:hypothetical protein